MSPARPLPVVKRMTLKEYFATEETSLPLELAYGDFRLADAPTPRHQSAVLDFSLALTPYVRARRLGEVWISPVDVVLDGELALVVQPDLIFVSEHRRHIVTDHVWGAPDMVLEVLSPRPRIGKLHERLEWFARYGVRECWLFHQPEVRLEILAFDRGAIAGATSFEASMPIRSGVLAGFELRLADILS